MRGVYMDDGTCPLSEREVVDRIISFSEFINQRSLYAYQVMFSRRIVETVLRQDGQTITGLFSRQCLSADVPLLMYDGTAHAASEAPGASKTSDSRQVFAVTTDAGRQIRSVTRDHYFQTTAGPKALYELKRGDKILCLRSQNNWQREALDIESLLDTQEFPTALFQTSPEQCGEFLRRLLGSVEYVTAEAWGAPLPGQRDWKWASFLQLLLAKCGVVARIVGPARAYRVEVHDLASLEALRAIGGTRHPDVLAKLRSTPAPPVAVAAVGPNGEVFEEDRITSIQVAGRRAVYDLEVPETGWYIAGGCQVLNSGKSETLACIALALVLILPALSKAFPADRRFKSFAHGFACGIFAPSKQHSGIIYSRMRPRVESSFFDSILEDDEINTKLAHSRGDSFAFDNGSRVEAHTASENVLNEGGTFHLVLVDESQKLSTQKIDKELRPMLASTNGSMVMIGTAFMGGGAFYKQIKTNLAQEQADGVKNHFEFPYEVVIKHRRQLFKQDQNVAHLNYEKWVQSELARLGHNVDNMSFKMNFRLIWGVSGAFALNIEAFKKLGRTTLEMNRPWFGVGRIVAGIDVAKKNDSTWVTVGYVDTAAPTVQQARFGREQSTTLYNHRTVLGWKMLQGPFEGVGGQYEQIVQYLSMYPQLDTVVMDATGMGDPVCERITSLLPGIKVIPYTFSTQSKHYMYTLYLQEVEAKRLTFPAGPATQQTEVYQEWIGQHETLVRTQVGQYLKCEAQSEDDHDDAADSGALFVVAGEIEAIPDVNPYSTQGSSHAVPVVDLGAQGRPFVVGAQANGRYSTRW